MEDILINLVEQFGYISIIILMLGENVFPPIPSEVVLLFGGFITTYTDMSIPFVILCATVGSVIGAGILYQIGSILNEQRLEKLLSGKIGKFVKVQDIMKAEKCFEKHGYRAVFIGRCIPVVRSLISIPAGMTKMKPFEFFILTIIGSTIWNTVLVIVGAVTGEAWQSSLKYIGYYSEVILILGILIVLLCIFMIYRRNQRNKK